MKHVVNIILMVFVSISSIYIYDRFYVRNYTEFENITLTDKAGGTTLEIGNFERDTIYKSGIQFRDTDGNVRAFIGVMGGIEGVGNSPQLVMYNKHETPILSMQQSNDFVFLNIGEINSEKSIMLTSDEEAASISVKGGSKGGLMNDIILFAASEPSLVLFGGENRVSLHAKEHEQSIVVVRDGKRVWASEQ